MSSPSKLAANRKLLLISNSYSRIGGKKSQFLEYYLEAIRYFLFGRKTVVFIPFAKAEKDWDDYTRIAAAALSTIGVNVIGIHEANDYMKLINEAEAIMIGGGNTYRLAQTMQTWELFGPIARKVVHGGIPYIGASAGSVIACPEFRTTNDKPIARTNDWAGLGIFPWQVNPHYFDPPPGSTYMGETRLEQMQEFYSHPENKLTTIVGLCEDCWLEVADNKVLLQGEHPAKLFRPGQYDPPIDWQCQTRLDLPDDWR